MLQVLDICDCSFAGIAAAQHGAGRVVCLEERSGPRELLVARTVAMGLEDIIVVWAGADEGEPWDAAWGEVDVVVGDGHYEQLSGVPLWQPLNLWCVFLYF